MVNHKILSSLLWELHLEFGGIIIDPNTLNVVHDPNHELENAEVKYHYTVEGRELRARKDIRQVLNRGWGKDDLIFTAYDEETDQSTIGVLNARTLVPTSR